MILKIFITGDVTIDKLEIAKALIQKNDDFSIAPKFVNDISRKDKIGDDYMYYMDNVDIDLSYKNNAFLYVKTNIDLTTGITLDMFYNNDIFPLDIYDFNSISDSIIYSYDSLIIWVDTKRKRKMNEEDSLGINHLIERTNNVNTLYFLDESVDHITDIIMKYLSSSVEERQKILDENN